VFVPTDRLTEAVEIIIKHLDAHSKVWWTFFFKKNLNNDTIFIHNTVQNLKKIV
jgi:hypothetical protein